MEITEVKIVWKRDIGRRIEKWFFETRIFPLYSLPRIDSDGNFVYSFRDKEAAVAFKMRWG